MMTARKADHKADAEGEMDEEGEQDDEHPLILSGRRV
jgi:hypothetical protein